MKTTEKVILELGLNRNFKKKDLAEKLGISRPTLDKKMRDNDWTDHDLFILNKLGIE